MIAEVLCPVHKAKMLRRKIAYGMPAPGAVEAGKFKNYIIGGCLDGMYGEYGYECSVDGDCYYCDGRGVLKKMFSDDNEEDNEI